MSDLELRGPDVLELAAAAVASEPTLLLPFTGELVDLREPARVAYALGQLRDAKRRLDELRGLLEALLRLESRRQGTKTIHLPGGVQAVVSGGSRVVYDGEQLLHELEAAGLPPERLAEAVKVVVEHRVDARVVKQLEASNPAYAAAVSRARSVEACPWRVSVKTP